MGCYRKEIQRGTKEIPAKGNQAQIPVRAAPTLLCLLYHHPEYTYI